MNYFMAPRSGEKSYKNYLLTIKHGVSLEKIEKYLDADGLEKLRKEEVIYAWGNREGTKNQWEKMNVGDKVIFYAQKRLVMVGEMYYKQLGPDLALAMWPPDEKGNPWAYTFFLRNLKHISIPIKVFNRIAGYKPGKVIQGFMPLQGEYLENIVEKYGSVDALLGEFSADTSDEIPTENEKVFININEDVNVTVEENPEISKKSNVTTRNGQKKSAPKKVDYKKKAETSALTGSKGEQLVVEQERKTLAELGRSDLAEKVTRVSVEDDTLGYDVLSYDIEGNEKYIEVKTTLRKDNSIQFYLSANEYNTARQTDSYYLYLVGGVNTKTPRISMFSNPFKKDLFTLSVDTYLVKADRV